MRGFAMREGLEIGPSWGRGISGFDDNSWRRARLAAARHLVPHPCGDVTINLGVGTVRFGGDDRKAGVRRFANFDFERHFAEEWHALAFRLGFGTAMTEQVRALAAMRAEKIAH